MKGTSKCEGTCWGAWTSDLEAYEAEGYDLPLQVAGSIDRLEPAGLDKSPETCYPRED